MSSISPHAVACAEQTAVRYACERCKTESVLAPGRVGLGVGGWLKARLIVVGRSNRRRDGTRRTFAEVRAELIARTDEDAYQALTGRFRFCHDCRRFVCPRCWNRSWSSCKSCVEQAMKRMSPARRRFRLGLSLTVIAASRVVLVVSVGSVVVLVAVR
ncbi:MAG TPA: hypothetical protein VF337_06950 [Candidatus Limnocylindrales bacterium]